MALYGFECTGCKDRVEKRMSFAQHEETKGKLVCEKCGAPLVQSVSRLNFKLAGNGWFDQGYGITQDEMDKNLDDEVRLEDTAYNMSAKDKARKEF